MKIDAMINSITSSGKCQLSIRCEESQRLARQHAGPNAGSLENNLTRKKSYTLTYKKEDKKFSIKFDLLNYPCKALFSFGRWNSFFSSSIDSSLSTYFVTPSSTTSFTSAISFCRAMRSLKTNPS